MDFQDYLKKKHLEYCNSVGEIITERDWVNDVLNRDLPRGDGLSYPSVNQWMNGGRNPDFKNVVRLIQVFGPEIMPFVGIYLPDDLASLVSDWHNIPDETKKEMLKIAEENKIPKTISA